MSSPQPPRHSLEDLPPDRAISAVAHDGSFRVLAARSTRTARGIVQSQQASAQVGRATMEHLADLATATTLVRLTMAPDYRVQGILQGVGHKGTLVADSWPDGGTRGLVRPAGGPVALGQGALVQVTRTLFTGKTQQGIVEMGDTHRVADAMTSYLVESEQVTATLGVATIVSEQGELLFSGGYVVQLLPEYTGGALAVMYERLRTDFADLPRVMMELDGSPDRLVEEILYGIEYTRTLEFELDYRCRCSEERLLAGLATVGQEDLRDMITRGEPLSISCDFCNRDYEIQPEALRGLLHGN